MLVVWDVDRTLTWSDTFLPFFRTVVGPVAWAEVLLSSLAEVAVTGCGRVGLKDALLRRAPAGRRSEDVQAVASCFASEVLVRRCRPDSLVRWAWHRRHDDRLVLASASPGVYLRPLAALLGAEHVVATALEVVDAVLTGARSSAICKGAEKACRVGDLIRTGPPAPVWVYSDSRSDRPTLALGDLSTIVRPLAHLPVPRDQVLAGGPR